MSEIIIFFKLLLVVANLRYFCRNCKHYLDICTVKATNLPCSLIGFKFREKNPSYSMLFLVVSFVAITVASCKFMQILIFGKAEFLFIKLYTIHSPVLMYVMGGSLATERALLKEYINFLTIATLMMQRYRQL